VAIFGFARSRVGGEGGGRSHAPSGDSPSYRLQVATHAKNAIDPAGHCPICPTDSWLLATRPPYPSSPSSSLPPEQTLRLQSRATTRAGSRRESVGPLQDLRRRLYLKAYASYCTLCESWKIFPGKRRRLASITPCALRGGIRSGILIQPVVSIIHRIDEMSCAALTIWYGRARFFMSAFRPASWTVREHGCRTARPGAFHWPPDRIQSDSADGRARTDPHGSSLEFEYSHLAAIGERHVNRQVYGQGERDVPARRIRPTTLR
jgi:hypothetical protein